MPFCVFDIYFRDLITNNKIIKIRAQHMTPESNNNPESTLQTKLICQDFYTPEKKTIVSVTPQTTVQQFLEALQNDIHLIPNNTITELMIGNSTVRLDPDTQEKQVLSLFPEEIDNRNELNVLYKSSMNLTRNRDLVLAAVFPNGEIVEKNTKDAAEEEKEFLKKDIENILNFFQIKKVELQQSNNEISDFDEKILWLTSTLEKINQTKDYQELKKLLPKTKKAVDDFFEKHVRELWNKDYGIAEEIKNVVPEVENSEEESEVPVVPDNDDESDHDVEPEDPVIPDSETSDDESGEESEEDSEVSIGPVVPDDDDESDHNVEPEVPVVPDDDESDYEIEPEVPIIPDDDESEHDEDPEFPVNPDSESSEDESDEESEEDSEVPVGPVVPDDDDESDHNVEPEVPVVPDDDESDYEIEPEVPVIPDEDDESEEGSEIPVGPIDSDDNDESDSNDENKRTRRQNPFSRPTPPPADDGSPSIPIVQIGKVTPPTVRFSGTRDPKGKHIPQNVFEKMHQEKYFHTLSVRTENSGTPEERFVDIENNDFNKVVNGKFNVNGKEEDINAYRLSIDASKKNNVTYDVMQNKYILSDKDPRLLHTLIELHQQRDKNKKILDLSPLKNNPDFQKRVYAFLKLADPSFKPIRCNPLSQDEIDGYKDDFEKQKIELIITVNKDGPKNSLTR